MFTTQHPILRLINNRFLIISSMIERYPAIISDYNKQVEKEAKKTAMDNADGDNEVYMSIYNSDPELDPLRTLSRRTFLPLEVESIFRNLGVPTIRA